MGSDGVCTLSRACASWVWSHNIHDHTMVRQSSHTLWSRGQRPSTIVLYQFLSLIAESYAATPPGYCFVEKARFRAGSLSKTNHGSICVFMSSHFIVGVPLPSLSRFFCLPFAMAPAMHHCSNYTDLTFVPSLTIFLKDLSDMLERCAKYTRH